MTKQLLTLSLGLFLVFAIVLSSTTAQAARATDKEESAQKVRIGSAPAAKLAGAEKIQNYIAPGRDDATVSLGADAFGASLSPGLIIGSTTYDYQHNCRMGRQVDWRGTQDVHFDWMVQSEFNLGSDRGTAYEAWDATAADLVFKGPDGGTDVHPRLGGGVNYSGYVGLDVGTDGRVICVCHHNEGAGYASTVWPDFSVLGGFFSPNQSRIPTEVMDFDASDTSQFIWPSMDWQVIGDDTVCHVLAEETLDGINPQKLHYFRRVGGYEVGVWDDPPIVIDTVADIAGTVAASRVSQKVALVWVANPDFDNPGSTESSNLGLQRTNDLFYRMSTNMGQSFGPNINVTGWDSSKVDWALHGDISALIDTEDRLHIIYDARETSAGFFQHFYGCRLFHWAEGQSIRVIKDANWDPPPSPATWCHGGAWNEMSIVKMQISECDDKLYALFVQFNDIYNGIDDDCHNRAFVNSEASGTANGELYISVSSNDGLNWDIARNLTNSYTAQCDSAPSLGGTLECDADMWPSMSRFGMEVTTGDFSGVPIVDPSGEYTGNFYLDVMYINDKHPGGAVQDAGVWTTNPVKWFRVPCVEPVPNPVLVFTPSVITDPTWTKPTIQLDTTVRLENIGNAPLNISATTVVELTAGYTGWLNYTPEITSISESDPNYDDLTVQMNFGGVITDDGVGVSGLIIFDSDSPTSPDTLEVNLIVADTVQRPEYATIHTTCKPVYVSNVAQLGNSGLPGYDGNDWGNMQFYEDCDTTNNASSGDDDIACYLYESAPFILRLDGGDTLLSTAIFDAGWLSTDGFRPQEGLTVDSGGGSFMVASTGRFLTRDSSIALESNIWAPSDAGNCGFMVQELKVYSNTDQGYDGLFIGEFMDWDIPSDSGVENGSDWDATRQMMYCYGGEYGPDSIVNNDCILADLRHGGFAYYAGYRKPHYNPAAYNTDSFPDIRGIWTHINPDWIEPSGGFVPGQVYKKMAAFGGYEKWQSTNPALEDSLYQDLNMVAVFGQFDLGKNDTLVFMKIFTTSKTGLGDLQTDVDLAHSWISAQGLFTWPPLEEIPNCCIAHGIAGDANSDGAINLLDILQVIAFVYQEPVGDPPNPNGCNALLDANGDGTDVDAPVINLLDILALIAHVYQEPIGDPVLCCPPGCIVP